MGARLPVLAAALWWGSLSAIGFVAVPLLFCTATQSPETGEAGSVSTSDAVRT